ncbi:MAG: hypothetical protein ACXAEN_25095, partial [Candidatus Thorarchaeota archaeon]
SVGITIDLTNKIESLDSDEYGGALHYSINTQVYPEISGLQTVRREIRPSSVDYVDDYIGALLFKNTMWLWERTGRGLDLDTLSYSAKKHILYSTVLDLLEDKEYEKFIVAGTRRQLGDLNVSVDSLIGR